MADIYTQAWVTIAATTSDSGTKGCFSIRDTAPVPEADVARSLLWSVDSTAYDGSSRPTVGSMRRAQMHWHDWRRWLLFLKESSSLDSALSDYRAATWNWPSLDGTLSYRYIDLDQTDGHKIVWQIVEANDPAYTFQARLSARRLKINTSVVTAHVQTRSVSKHLQGVGRLLPWSRGERTTEGVERNHTIWLGFA